MAEIKEDKGDASADTGTTYSISLDDVFQGVLESVDDKDWIKVELTAGTIYDFTLSGVDGESAELGLFDSDANLIAIGGVIPSGAKLIYSPKVTGTYYIHAGTTVSDQSVEYELSLVENTIPVGTYDEIADYLTDGYWEWQDGSRVAFPVGPGGTLTADISVLPEEGQQLARWALEAWTNVSGINFEFVEDNNADIVFKNEPGNVGSGGPTAIRNGLIISAGVNIPDVYYTRDGNSIDSFTFYAYLHEIGHALGLGHPGPYPTDFDNPVSVFGIENIYLIDSYQASLMSYIHQANNTYIDASFAHNVTPMIVDIIAIQNLYGVPDSINVGDTIYGYQSNVDGYLGEYFRLWTGEANPFIDIDLTYTDFPTIKPTLVDLDSDGDPDVVVGHQSGALHYIENAGTPADPVLLERTGTDNPFDGISVESYSTPTVTDLDGDGDSDLVVGNVYGNIAYFENAGTAASPDFTQRTGAANPFDDITMGSWSTLALADLDGDGDLDLAAGLDDGDVGYYENTGTSANPDFTQRTGETNPLHNIKAGSYSTPEFVDVDNDDDFDLVIGSGREGIHYFENTGTTTSPTFTQRTGNDNPFSGLAAGAFFGADFVDLNGDSNLDLIIGTQLGNILYFKNTGTNADPEFSPQSLTNPTTFTIYDNGGNDTLDLRTDTKDQRVYLRPEGISDVYGLTGNLVIARDTVIENYIAGSGNDLVVGNAVANYISGRDGNDRIWGSGGDDVLEGGPGADQLDGDAGMDWVSYRGSDAAVTVNLADSTVSGGHAEGDVLTEIENVIGSDHADVLTGNDGANRFEGGAGADQLNGGDNNDWVSYEGSNEGVTVDLAEDTYEGGHAQGDVISNIENVTGSGHADVLKGDGNANRLEGGPGNDELDGAGGADTLQGGAGDDLLYGSAGADSLGGGDGFDVLSYANSNEGVTINLEEGTVTGGYAQGDVITGIEHIIGSAHGDILTGDGAANTLHGIGGDDELQGNGGDDTLEGGEGSDRLDGGAGADWLSYAGSDGAVSVRLYDGYAARGHAEGDTLSNFENLRGSAHADVLAGDGGANRLEGGAGDDQLTGGSGDDELEGGAGADSLDGGVGVDWVSYLRSDAGVSVDLRDNTVAGGRAEGDVISGFENIAGSGYADELTGDAGANEISGNGGDDELHGQGGDDVLAGGAGADRLQGGTGIDTLSYRLSVAGVRVNLEAGTAAGGHAEGDTFSAIENLTGSVYGDVLTGDDGENRLDGAGGDDELSGGLDNDQLIGGVGHDTLEGGEGSDRLDGGSGIDWVSYSGSTAGVTVDLAARTAQGGHAQGDVIFGFENLLGSGFDDILRGDDASNVLHGLDGADELYGKDGDDELRGNGGDDVLEGGVGADRLDGGTGVDAASYQDSDAAIRIELAYGTGEGGHAEGVVLVSIENVIGSDFDDVIRGDDGANRLTGGNGNDWLVGGSGADRLDGGVGVDWIDYWSSDTGITVNLAEGSLEGGDAQGDVIVNIENVQGSHHDDVLTGDSGNNTFNGLDGADRLDGGEGSDWVSYGWSDTGVTVNLKDGTGEGGHAEGDVIVNIEHVEGSRHDDVLIGDSGDNGLIGFDGNDQLSGNEGDDVMLGLDGDDVFVFEAGHGDDSILDFADGEDKIDLSAFNLSGFADLDLSSDTSVPSGTIIDLTAHGGGTINLSEFDIANLDETDFLF